MERSPTPKILRLAPYSVFISFLYPFFIHYLSYISLLLPFFSLTAFKGPFVPCLHTTDALSALIISGGFFNRSLFIRASCPTHVLYFRMYLLFTIICIDMT